MRRISAAASLVALAAAACAPAHRPVGSAEPDATATPVASASPSSSPAGAGAAGPMPIAVSSAEDGSVTLVDRVTLAQLARVEGSWPEPVPMPLVADAARRVFYVSNFNGALGRVPVDGGAPETTLLPSSAAGLAISPDGKRLAVGGALEPWVAIVDLEKFDVVASARLGKSAGHGIETPQPVWLADGSAVLAEDTDTSEAVLVGVNGAVKARRKLASPPKTFLIAKDGTPIALCEGAAKSPAEAVVLSLPALDVAREIPIPLGAGESARLHGGALSPDGETLVVANVGNLRDAAPTTVAAFRWRTGERLWSTQTSRNAGHVAFLDAKRIVVLGHRAAALELLDATTGAPIDSWSILGAGSLGHALDVAPDGSVTVLDSAVGKLLRYKDGQRVGESPVLGAGSAEASLPQ